MISLSGVSKITADIPTKCIDQTATPPSEQDIATNRPRLFKIFGVFSPFDEATNRNCSLKQQIVTFLNLTSVQPENIKDDEPLFGEGLGLDSIDSLELIVLLHREYGINIQDPKEGRKVLVDINTMVAYIEEHRTK